MVAEAGTNAQKLQHVVSQQRDDLPYDKINNNKNTFVNLLEYL